MEKALRWRALTREGDVYDALTLVTARRRVFTLLYSDLVWLYSRIGL
jgi:hypothetical protein